MTNAERDEKFQFWLTEMDSVVNRLIARVPQNTAERLNYSSASLDVLEAWLLSEYASVLEIKSESQKDTWDGASRYVGETYRKILGGA